MNDRVAVAAVFAPQPDGRCSGVQTDRNEPDRFRGNLQQKSPKFLRSGCAREGVVGAASRPTGRPLERRPDRSAAGRSSIILWTCTVIGGLPSRFPRHKDGGR